ncbi:tetratricopeptide repeat protein [Candidatus Avelusimicrobium fimicolum]|jgi:tetratricopeptide (TPR) repeat protein|uniref:tetratricopeptide repeat protein n=1 Tax=Candidatus Avelusimicrobium fimicolum TaxID=3416216 RepID=UPI003D0EA502
MEKECKHKCECKYKETCNVSKVLIIAVVAFFMVCGIMLFMLFQYHQKVNTNFQSYISKTTEIISNIKVENQKNKQVIISDELSKAISKVNQNEYETFLRTYYESQNNWLNIWLTILTIILGVLGIGIPLCFLKFYESKKEEFNIIIREVEKKKETMTQDLDEVKDYVKKAKQSENKALLSQLFVAAARESHLRHYELALTHVEKALRIDCNNYDILCLKAAILLEKEDYLQSEAIFSKVLNIKRNPNVLNDYGHVLSCLNKDQEAIQILTEAISMNPHQACYITNRGVVYMKKGDFDLALQDFTKGLSLSRTLRDKEQAVYNLIECYLKKTMFENALKMLNYYESLSKNAHIFSDDKTTWIELTNKCKNSSIAQNLMTAIHRLKEVSRKDYE